MGLNLVFLFVLLKEFVINGHLDVNVLFVGDERVGLVNPAVLEHLLVLKSGQVVVNDEVLEGRREIIGLNPDTTEGTSTRLKLFLMFPGGIRLGIFNADLTLFMSHLLGYFSHFVGSLDVEAEISPSGSAFLGRCSSLDHILSSDFGFGSAAPVV